MYGDLVTMEAFSVFSFLLTVYPFNHTSSAAQTIVNILSFKNIINPSIIMKVNRKKLL